MDCSLPGSSAHGIFQARVLEWGTITCVLNPTLYLLQLQKSFNPSPAMNKLTTKSSGSVHNLLFLLCHPRMGYTVRNSVHKLLGFILSLLSTKKTEMSLSSVYFYFLSVPNDLFWLLICRISNFPKLKLYKKGLKEVSIHSTSYPPHHSNLTGDHPQSFKVYPFQVSSFKNSNHVCFFPCCPLPSYVRAHDTGCFALDFVPIPVSPGSHLMSGRGHCPPSLSSCTVLSRM